jgi:hypothetical protein
MDLDLPSILPVTPGCDSDLLISATKYNEPPTELPVAESHDCSPRFQMTRAIFLIRELLLGGLQQKGVKLSLPEKLGPTKMKRLIRRINPLDLCKTITYPPTYHIRGSKDHILCPNHMLSFHRALVKQGVASRVVTIDEGHTFDMSEAVQAEALQWLVEKGGFNPLSPRGRMET